MVAEKPEKTRASREAILTAAIEEFCAKGYDGARVDEIVQRAGVSKNLAYHYFGSKEALFIEALEVVYDDVRRRQSDLRIREMEPEAGMRQLVEMTANIWAEMPQYVRLLTSENLHQGRHVRKSGKIAAMYNPLRETIEILLRKGEAQGIFRAGIDPIDLYISVTGLSAHYIANLHTFEALFRTRLEGAERWRQRLDHMTEMVLAYLRGSPRQIGS